MFNRDRILKAEIALYFGAGLVSGMSTDLWVSIGLPISIFNILGVGRLEPGGSDSKKFLSYTVGWLAGATFRVTEFATDVYNKENRKISNPVYRL